MKQSELQLKDQVVLLTGGAGPLNLALAARLSSQGAHVHLALPLDAELTPPDDNGITVHQFSLSSRTDFEKVVDTIISRHQHIDLLINLSSFAVFGLVKDLSIEDWEEVFDHNILSATNAIELVYPAMVSRGQGHIVNLGSIVSDTRQPGSIPFATSKAFILGLDRSLRPEAKRTGIHVNLILPGYLPPGIFQQSRTIKANEEDAVKAHTLVQSTVEQFAEAILAGVIRKKRILYFPKFQARFLWFLSHWFPAALNPLQKRLFKPFYQPPSLASQTHRPPE